MSISSAADGQSLPADLVARLAGPLAPGQFVQADGTTGTLSEGGAIYQGDIIETTTSTTTTPSSTTGRLVDGPIYNAEVFLDVDGDGAYDSGEPVTFTDANGYYTLAGAGAYQIVAKPGATVTMTADQVSLFEQNSMFGWSITKEGGAVLSGRNRSHRCRCGQDQQRGHRFPRRRHRPSPLGGPDRGRDFHLRLDQRSVGTECRPGVRRKRQHQRRCHFLVGRYGCQSIGQAGLVFRRHRLPGDLGRSVHQRQRSRTLRSPHHPRGGGQRGVGAGIRGECRQPDRLQPDQCGKRLRLCSRCDHSGLGRQQYPAVGRCLPFSDDTATLTGVQASQLTHQDFVGSSTYSDTPTISTDFLVGSNAKDVFDAGAGNDIIATISGANTSSISNANFTSYLAPGAE